MKSAKILLFFTFALFITVTSVAANSIGTIDQPPGVDRYISNFGSQTDNALLFFISRLLRLSTILAGVWALFTFMYAGYMYITSKGDSGVHQKVRDLVTMSVLGLAFIVFSYTIAGLISLIFFGDAGFILNPTL